MISQNKGGKGNPYHNDKSGEFTSKDSVGGGNVENSESTSPPNEPPKEDPKIGEITDKGVTFYHDEKNKKKVKDISGDVSDEDLDSLFDEVSAEMEAKSKEMIAMMSDEEVAVYADKMVNDLDQIFTLNDNFKKMKDKRLLASLCYTISYLNKNYPLLQSDGFNTKDLIFSYNKLPAGVIAQAYHPEGKSCEITIATGLNPTYNDAVDLEERELRSGFHGDVNLAYQGASSLAHEYGHILQRTYAIAKALGGMGDYDNFHKTVVQNFKKKYPNKSLAYYATGYSFKNGKEFFAECFSGVVCGDNNPLNEVFKETLDQIYYNKGGK